jgi:hypothetical protein
MFSVPAKRLSLTRSLNEHDALLQEYDEKGKQLHITCVQFILLEPEIIAG